VNDQFIAKGNVAIVVVKSTKPMTITPDMRFLEMRVKIWMGRAWRDGGAVSSMRPVLKLPSITRTPIS
jgi:hypothetical protein